ncbi:MAG: hypothetical protein J6A23_13965 [Thermoguttaceae bacterium]|nr:hypothetical protein [Thermoguttaceae bacterium]MBP3694947.1 hypothetical protein [Thermoguttaceae bacterium]
MDRAPIAVFFALKNESGYFEDRLKKTSCVHANGFRIFSGTLGKHAFLSVVTGAGESAAGNAAEAICRIHQPRLVISAGFAGGLAPELPKHALFLPNEFAGTDSADWEKERLSLFSRLSPEHLPTELRKETRFGGRLLTVRNIVTKTEEKRELALKYSAQAVDMETRRLAKYCRTQNLPFLAVRSISDAAGEPIPDDVQTLVNQKTTAARFGAAFQLLLKRPGSAADLYRLYESSVASALKLADFLEALSDSGLFDFLSENFYPPQEPEKLLSA